MSAHRRWGWLVLLLAVGGWSVATLYGPPDGSLGLLVAPTPVAAEPIAHDPDEHHDHSDDDPEPDAPDPDSPDPEDPDADGPDPEDPDPDTPNPDDPDVDDPEPDNPDADDPDDQDDQDDLPEDGDDGDGQGESPAAPEPDSGCAGSGLPVHNGAQEGGRCVPTTLGEVPDPELLPGVVITSPTSGATLRVGEAFEVAAQVDNLATGNFADPDADYVAQPQRLDPAGRVLGHAHVVIQQLTADGQRVPSATEVAFFLGLNEPAGAGGRMTATVPGLEEPGVYRIQVNTASYSHQPVVSPVARHLAPVDVIRVRVVAGNGPDDEGAGGAEEDEPPAGLPLLAATQGPGGAGDGIPPAPNGTTGGGGPAPGSGGTGDGLPPPPITSAPEPPAPADGQPSPGGLLGAAGEGGVNWLVVGGGVLIFVGAGVAALSRLRSRRLFGRPGWGGYQGLHLQPDAGQDTAGPADATTGQDPDLDTGQGLGQETKAGSRPSAGHAAAALSGELRRLRLPDEPDPTHGNRE